MTLLFFTIFCSISPSLGIYFYVFLLGFEDGITVLEGVTLSRHVGISLAFGVFFNLLINRLSIKSLFKNYLSFLIMLFIFFVWIFISGLWSVDVNKADEKLVSYLSNFIFIIIVFIIVEDVKTLNNILLAFIISISIASFGVIYQYFILGFERAAGIGGSVNAIGNLAAFATLFSLGFLKTGNISRIQKSATNLSIILSILTVIASGSRSSMVVLLIGILYNFKFKVKNIIYLSLAMFLISIFIKFLNTTTVTRFDSFLEPGKRIDLLLIGWELFSDNIFIGLGNGSVIAASSNLMLSNPIFSSYGAAIHNTYFTILIELGLIGFLIYVAIIVHSRIRFLKFQNHLITLYNKNFSIVFIMLLITLLFTNREVDKFFWLMIGLSSLNISKKSLTQK